jgi:para-aminobenzoate synthetase component I
VRVTQIFSIENVEEIKQKLLLWSQQFREVCYFDSNQNQQATYSKFDVMLGVDAFTSIQTDSFSAFETLSEYQQTTQDYILGYLSYDLKNGTENLSSTNFDGVKFPDIYFFQPKKLFIINENSITFSYLAFVADEIDYDWTEILETNIYHEQLPKIGFVARTTKSEYLNKVNQVLKHIQRGDIYEANFCMEFYAQATINPLQVFWTLNHISKAPFASFFKLNQLYAISASPERYVQKTKQTIISQPIKGTAKRGKNDIEDALLKNNLEDNLKERTENVMIVDLVRNDLSKTAIAGSVVVPELCKVYTFCQVHQMISTIQAELDTQYNAVDVLKTTFPMGSMTGAPKLSAMQICESLENFKRGLYSGAIGYFTPTGDFDFNVVIRSILYNNQQQYVSYAVGSAITAQAIPEQEYEECLIKASALFSIFNSNAVI